MENRIILLVVLGTVGIMLMAFALIFFVSLYRKKALENRLKVQELEAEHQADMLAATLKSVESERERIGTELHDNVGAMLSAVKLNLQSNATSVQSVRLDETLGALNETIETVRTISHDLMPVVLKKYGLRAAVEDLDTKVNGIDIKIGRWCSFDVNEKVRLMLYRIIQEFVNNTIKYAKANSITISTHKNDSICHLAIADDGIGFPEEITINSKGMGLWNILNRTKVMGGKVIFFNSEIGGACMDLEFPIETP